MKKLIFQLIIIITVLMNTVYAQWSVGIMGGVNFSDMKADVDIKSRTLTSFGAVVEYSMIDQLSLVALPTYVQNGGIRVRTETEPELTIKGSYLDMPIFLKYSFSFIKVMKPFLFAGPSVEYRLNLKMKGEFAGLDITADLKNVSKDFDLGIGLGAGVEIPLDILSIVIEGKYYLGLTDQHKNGTFLADAEGLTIEGKFDDTNKFKYRGIQIIAGITFTIGE